MGVHMIPVVLAVPDDTRAAAVEVVREIFDDLVNIDWWLPNDGEPRDGFFLDWSRQPPKEDLGEGIWTDGEGVG